MVVTFRSNINIGLDKCGEFYTIKLTWKSFFNLMCFFNQSCHCLLQHYCNGSAKTIPYMPPFKRSYFSIFTIPYDVWVSIFTLWFNNSVFWKRRSTGELFSTLLLFYRMSSVHHDIVSWFFVASSHSLCL